MPHDRKPRLLVFVIAYYAEETLTLVLERIPRSIFNDYDCEVLVVDDASGDRTAEIGRAYRRAHPEIAMTVLRNEFNQGYGGNQKVGYAFAIREGFDFVAMVHGDGSTRRRNCRRWSRRCATASADAVFGSRMMTRFGALKGGMPLYKFVGNRILTRTQNLLLGTSLTEFHSGYRVYSVAALKKIPYRLNSNVFHFDTEIIIQLFNAGQRIVELPIPTYYGDEICRVNGMKYAKDVMLATLRNVAHRAGLLYQRRFEPVSEQDNAHYDLKLGYAEQPPVRPRRGPAGRRGDRHRRRTGRHRERAGEEGLPGGGRRSVHAEGRLDSDVVVFTQDLDDELDFDVRGYDYLLLLDVIEHLKNPEKFLDRLRAQFDYSPRTLILTTPNIAFGIQRLMLLFGQFNYGKAGILDRTHTRLFTFRSLRQLLADAGFRIKEIRGVPAPFPKVFGKGSSARTAMALNQLLIRISRTMFSYQIFVIAETTPDVDFILEDAKRRSELREQLGIGPTDEAASVPTPAPAASLDRLRSVPRRH